MSEISDPDVKLDATLQSIIDEVPRAGRYLWYCAACDNLITSDETRTERLGAHDHQLTNPYGFRFHVGCFDSALGCAVDGAPNHADSWFPGYVWRLADCALCRGHLGWFFDGGGEPFFGLILDRLRRRESAADGNA